MPTDPPVGTVLRVVPVTVALVESRRDDGTSFWTAVYSVTVDGQTRTAVVGSGFFDRDFASPEVALEKLAERQGPFGF